jgi:predicted acylesterase/phospholipase RssA
VSEAYELLVLVHPDGTRSPSGTRRWLEPRPFLEEHHHVRWDQEEDVARLARFLAGRAVGLVLGGGGARGFAHIGVLKALGEAGIPVDMVGGTSMGASIAAQHAMGWSPQRIEDVNRRVWIEIRPHRRLTLPFLSLVGSREAEACGRMMYGDLEIEDLWIPFFCVSSNLTTAEMVIHRSGSLLWAATASASLPGFAVPVLSGRHLLVDGALLNNLPTDVMRRLGAGTVIASEVSVEEDAAFAAERIPSPWEVMRGRARFPSLMEVVLRASMLHSTYLERIAVQDADLCLRPPVDHYSLMDFPKLAAFVATGYEHAREVLQRWSDPPARPPEPAAAPHAVPFEPLNAVPP